MNEIEALLDGEEKPDKFANIKAKAIRFSSLFNNAEGQAVLRDLEDEFENVQLADINNVNATYFKLGGRDLLQYIKQLIQAGERAQK